MRTCLIALAALTGFVSHASAALLYDNTTVDLLLTVPFSVGPYTGLGDQIQLTSAATATQAKIELFNNGDAGTFDVDLELFQIDSPVGSSLGLFLLSGVSSTGGDVIDLTFNLGAGVAVPQNLVFVISVANQSSANMDLGIDLFGGPSVGFSDPTLMIVASAGPSYSEIPSAGNVYFQLSGTPVATTPEPSSFAAMLAGIAALCFIRRHRVLNAASPVRTTSLTGG
jgi:hypothetical protein